MSSALAEAVDRLHMKPGQVVREIVNGYMAELRLLDSEQSLELELPMIQAWYQPPSDPIWTGTARLVETNDFEPFEITESDLAPE